METQCPTLSTEDRNKETGMVRTSEQNGRREASKEGLQEIKTGKYWNTDIGDILKTRGESW